MLADDLIETFRSSAFQTGAIPGILEANISLARDVELSRRFYLDREAAWVVHQVGDSAPSKLLAALKVCRLPFDSIFVEFAFADRMAYYQSEQASEAGLPPELHEDASAPSRLGFLFEKDGPDGIVMTPVWNHGRNSVVTNTSWEQVGRAFACIRIDVGDDQPPSSPAQTRSIMTFKSAAWNYSDAERRAGVDLEARISEVIPSAMQRFWAEFEQPGREAARAQMMKATEYDLRNEWRFLIGFLTVINSRNLVQTQPVADMSKLNKARIKRGRQPMLPAQEIRLSLSRVQRARLGLPGSGGRMPSAAHLVRGHWKLRKNGLFWWMPHSRGLGRRDGEPSKPYRVTG